MITRRSIGGSCSQPPVSRPFDQDRTGHTPMGDRTGPVKRTIRVLFVDNEDNLCMIFGRILNRDAEIEAVTTQDPTQVLDLLASGTFDVLVTDTIMTGMSGTELARRVRQEHPNVKIIAVSGTSPSSHYDEGTVHAFLEKPLDSRVLIAKIKELAGAEPQTQFQGATDPVHGAPALAQVPEGAPIAELTQAALAVESASSEAATQPPPTQQVKPIRLLVVDDEDYLLAATKRVFRDDPSVQVTTTTDPTQVLGLLASGEFDVLLTDSAMPKKSGPQLAQEVRAAHPNLKIIGMSGGTHTPDSYATGTIDAFLNKPYDVDELTTLVKRLARGEPVQEVKQIKVLVVDDDGDTAALIVEELSPENGFKSEQVTDPTKVLSLLASGNFDVLVTDTKMPGMMGFELARLVRERYPDVKIVAMSSSHGREDYDSGTIDEFVSKPLGVLDIREVVKRVAN